MSSFTYNRGTTRKNIKNVSFNEDVITNDKLCVPGPNARFGKKDLPFYNYLENINNPGSLGCNENQYPKYTDNKYCCVDASNKSTKQEELDYVNDRLEAAFDNVNPSVFNKYQSLIHYLLHKRNELLKTDHTLQDNLTVPPPYKNVDDWYNNAIIEASYISNVRPDPDIYQDRINLNNNRMLITKTTANTSSNRSNKYKDTTSWNDFYNKSAGRRIKHAKRTTKRTKRAKHKTGKNKTNKLNCKKCKTQKTMKRHSKK